MAGFFKAIMGEVFFLADKLTAPRMEDKRLHNLERLLLRVNIIIEEAERYHITNRAMIHQLNLFRKETYRGLFTMDKLKSGGNEADGYGVSHSFSLSKFNPAKRIFFSTDDTHKKKDLHQAVQNLNKILEDADELIVLFKNYPPRYRQPYSMHLYIGKCMFGRQMEMERIMDFLMRKEHPGVNESIPVLPIVGPIYVGKSTLIAHVYKDARVCNYFSRVMVITADGVINNQNLSTLKERGVIIGEKERCTLVIMEFSEDVKETEWNSLYSLYSVYCGRGSKMIITSRWNKVMKFGTTQTLVLNYLPLEAYWYFFKILTFRSTYSSGHPILESLAMEIARGQFGSFIGGNITSGLLRNNFCPQFWSGYLTNSRKNIQRNVSLFGAEPHSLCRNGKPTICQITDNEMIVWDKPRTFRAEENVPTITIEDVAYGNVKYEGEFDVLLHKSNIPPYNSFIVSYRIEKSQ